jgi:hypothetical protein
MIDTFAAGFLFALGLAAGATLLAAAVLVTVRAWRAVRYSRPGWWAWRWWLRTTRTGR